MSNGIESEPGFPAYQLIDTAEAWERCLKVLGAQPRIAVDLEANSLYAYQEKVCLLQFSIPGEDFILDPLAGFDLEGLGGLLADPRIEKVFHASDYDLMLLKRGHGWEVSNLFDTMWAGRILGHTKMGLATFLQEFYGIELSKRHQKADWAQRPLPEALLAYAQKDTHYLLRLRDDLAARLEAAGRLEEAREIFANECRVKAPDRRFDPDDFWVLRGARRLPERNQAVLRALYIFRDREARRRNVPPFKVLANEKLVLIAQHMPRTPEELGRIDGLSARVAQRMGRRLIQTVEEALRNDFPRPSQKRETFRDPEAGNRYRRLFAWRKDLAQQRGVESDVIMSRETMWDIAHRNPRNADDLAAVPTLGPVRAAMYSEAILSLMQ